MEESAEPPAQRPSDEAKSQGGDDEKKQHPRVIYMIAICATIGGALFGYDSGIVNGALLVIEKDFVLTSFWRESIVTATVAGAALFSIIAGVVADAIGRKKTIMGAALVFTLGSFIMGFAGDLQTIFVGRFVVGAGIGLVSCIVPIYVSECSPKEIRGFLITLNQLFITIGIVLAAILAGVLQNVKYGWRLMLGLAAVPGIIQFLFFIRLPESPRYLVMKDDIATAAEVLKRIRAPGEDTDKELREIKESVDAESENQGLKVWAQVFRTRHVRKALLIGSMLQFFQQLSGINTIIYYSATILKSAGFDSSLAVWLSVVPATVNFLATFIGLWAVERLGRRLVLALSFFAIAVSCLVLSLGDVAGLRDAPPTEYWNDPIGSYGKCSKYSTCAKCLTLSHRTCGYCAINKDDFREKGSCVMLDDFDVKDRYALKGRCADSNGTFDDNMKLMKDYCPNNYSIIPLIGLILFVLSFAPGAGPMPWTINAEIYPMWARSACNSMATLTNWSFNVVVSFFFMTLVRTFQAFGTFFIFLVICISAAIFVLLFVPETKGRSLEEIEWLFMDAKGRAEQKRKIRESTFKRQQQNQQQAA